MTLLEWNNLDLNIRNSKSLTSFKGNILKFMRPSENSVFLCNNPKGIQLLTRLSRFENMNFSLTSKTPLSQFVMILKRLITTFFTFYSTPMED